MKPTSSGSRLAFFSQSLCLFLFCVLFVVGPARATFSICAVDPETGEVGSAGASCIAGSLILSDVHPGVGVVHTQSFWNSSNQNYARQLMDQGFSPQEIVDMVVANDAQGNPGVRQYGVVDLVDGGRSAAFTGADCFDWKGDTPGATYSVQGNILLGPEIIDDMEAAFLAQPGSLATRLMAALQAAKVPGADTRCQSAGKSAISAFVRVARPGDADNDLYLDLNVNNTAQGQDPIDLLQAQFDEWQVSSVETVGTGLAETPFGLRIEPNPVVFSGQATVRFELSELSRIDLQLFDAAGRWVSEIAGGEFEAGTHSFDWSPSQSLRTGIFPENGVFFLRMRSDRGMEEGQVPLEQGQRVIVLR